MNNALGRFADGFRVMRRVMAAVPEAERLDAFANACAEAATYVSKGLDRTVVADELVDMATTYGIHDADVVQYLISGAFEKIEEPDRVPDDISEPQKPNGKHKPVPFLSKAEFLGEFVPPDYLVDGILQRRFFYCLTGQTGHAKTAIALLLCELISSSDNSMLGKHRVEPGRVLYFVGENADDIRMRVIGADSQREHGDPMADRITFIPGQFNIAQMQARIAQHADSLGGVDFVVVDTSAAYFLGQDEISNPQMRAHAAMMRRLCSLPGGPCVLALCHPIKHVTEPSQLLPRGGGAFLAEVDGNLTAWKHDENLIELHHGKIRGPGFEPLSFKLEKIQTTKLVDRKGRILPTVRAVPITQSDEDQQVTKTRSDEDHVLAARLKVPEAESVSIADIAVRCGFTSADGTPHKSRVFRIFERLEKAKPALAYRDRGQWKLTEKGKEAARIAALRLAAQAERERSDQLGMDLH